jgi:hypothetical protein
MAEREYVFTTIALQFKTRRYPPAGFFCLWDDELTFVHSKYLQLVYLPMSYFGFTFLSDRVLPTGPDDPRTRFRIPYADLTKVTERKKWAQIAFHTRSGEDRYLGGGSVNRAFKWTQIVKELEKALEAAGYTVHLGADGLTVEHGAG